MSSHTLPEPKRQSQRRCSCGRFATRVNAAQPDLFDRPQRLAEVDPVMRELEQRLARARRWHAAGAREIGKLITDRVHAALAGAAQ